MAIETVRYCCLHYKSPPIQDDTPRDKYLSHALVALTQYLHRCRPQSYFFYIGTLDMRIKWFVNTNTKTT